MQLARLDTRVYRVPTDRPEADGTYQWDSTTIVVVEAVAADGTRGLGYSYTAAAAAGVVHDLLEPAVVGCPLDNVRQAWDRMLAVVRNVGRPGVAATAISAVDVALWDLKARLDGRPLYRLLGAHREAVPVYGSGGFTSYTLPELQEQLSGWVDQGMRRVKMKIGTDWGRQPDADAERVRAAREAIGDAAQLMVDANGAYTAQQALRQAQRFADQGVGYFEEPVSSDHLAQLALVRQHVPPGMAVAAGEYGYDPWYFRDMLQAGAVDILQADVTRCLGITGWLEAAALAHAFGVSFSAHCAPALHTQVGCVAPSLAHVEYFHDHVGIEHLLFADGARLEGGTLCPDPSAPGLGLELKEPEAERWRIG